MWYTDIPRKRTQQTGCGITREPSGTPRTRPEEAHSVRWPQLCPMLYTCLASGVRSMISVTEDNHEQALRSCSGDSGPVDSEDSGPGAASRLGRQPPMEAGLGRRPPSHE